MSDILCIYYSRTGNTRRAVKAIAADLGARRLARLYPLRHGRHAYLHPAIEAL